MNFCSAKKSQHAGVLGSSLALLLALLVVPIASPTHAQDPREANPEVVGAASDNEISGSEISGVTAAQAGVRFQTTGGVQSVSGRLDFRGRVVLTMVGQRLGDVPRFWNEEALAPLDGSGLLQSLAFESTETSSGLALTTAILETSAPVQFRVEVEALDVEVVLEETLDVQGDGNASRDPQSGRRVLSDADLEPVPGETSGASSPSSQPGDARGSDRVPLENHSPVNFRPAPTLDSVPMMLLPEGTPLWGVGWEGNWRKVALGELEGWVDSSFVVGRTVASGEANARPPREEFSEPEFGDDDPVTFDLGEPGAWEDRVAEAMNIRAAATQSISQVELTNRERALQEATSRQLETAKQDLRSARAESAELRIDLARSEQQLELALERLAAAEERLVELEALVPQLRADAVESRAELETVRSNEVALSTRLGRLEQLRLRLAQENERFQEERNAARSQVILLGVEVDALREALNRQTLSQLEISNTGNGVGTTQTPDLTERPQQTTLTPGEQGEVEATLAAWAQAWSSQDANEYLSFYSDSFHSVHGDASAWRRGRQDRLSQPEWIEVEVSDVTAEKLLDSEEPKIRVQFRQSYRSPNYQDVVRKIMVLRSESSGWKIVSEHSSHVLSTVPSVR